MISPGEAGLMVTACFSQWTHVTAPINTQRGWLHTHKHSCSRSPICTPAAGRPRVLAPRISAVSAPRSGLRVSGSSPPSLNARTALWPAAVGGNRDRGAVGSVFITLTASDRLISPPSTTREASDMKTILAAYSGVLKGTGSSILSALQDLPLALWPCRSKMEKHLQVISVLQWIMSFLALGVACTVLLIYMFCTDCWLISAIYTTWLIVDWNTPKQGGRRSSWVRNWTVWTYFRDYFPIRLIKTHNLLPSRNYIFGYHPHGIFCFGGFCNFGTEATGFSKKFPGIKPSLATLAGNFRLPVLREYLMSGGICPVNKNSIDYLLSCNGTGNAVIIVVGGAAESLQCTPGMNSVTLKNRKGFVRLALRKGSDLVPVYSFGENDAYKQVIFEEGTYLRYLQKRLQKIIGFAPCLFHGCGLFSNSWGFVPFCKPITTIVGEPITVPKIEDPTEEMVDLYHAMYIKSLQCLFDKYKTRFGLKESDVLHIQ